MHVELYRPLGRTALDNAAEIIGTCVSRWAEDWCVDASSETCQVPNVDDLRHCSDGDDMRWHMAGTQSAGHVAIAVQGSASMLANEFVSMGADDAASAYADAIAEKSLRDLSQALLLSGISEDLELRCGMDIAQLPQGLQRRAIPGALGAEVRVHGCRLQVRCDSIWVARNLPLSLCDAVGLCSIEDALQDSDIVIQCRLDLGEIPLEEARLLQPGQVVRTNMPLGQASYLDVAQSGRIADCKIGRQDKYRAIEILST